MMQAGHVHADLVRAAGLQTCLDEREAAQAGNREAREAGHVRDRFEPFAVDRHATVAVGCFQALQRKRESTRT